jgi:hypothetical protein
MPDTRARHNQTNSLTTNDITASFLENRFDQEYGQYGTTDHEYELEQERQPGVFQRKMLLDPRAE